MASIVVQKNKGGVAGWQIVFSANAVKCLGCKRTVYLSARIYTEEIAQDCRLIASELERIARTGAEVSDDLARRIERRPDFKSKLIAAGALVASEETTLGELWRQYLLEFDRPENWSPNTSDNVASRRKAFFRFFDENAPADSVKPSDATAFESFLLRRGSRDGKAFSVASKAGVLKTTKAVFSWGVKRELVQKSPFAEIKAGKMTNEERLFEVTPEIFAALLDACGTLAPEKRQTWRALLVLWRCCGMRRSEPLELKWRDVDFNANRLRIYAPKTKSTRVCPLFAPVRRELEALKAENDALGIDDERVIWRERNENTLYTKFSKIVISAGYEPWPRLFNNLRASAASFIAANYGPKEESRWVGHSERISFEHYQMETRDSLARAVDETFGLPSYRDDGSAERKA